MIAMTAECLCSIAQAWEKVVVQRIASVSEAIGLHSHSCVEVCMHSSRIGRRVVMGLGMAAIVSVAAIGTVAARTAPPTIGRAIDFSDEGCFSLFDSHIRNDCKRNLPVCSTVSGAQTLTLSGVFLYSRGRMYVACSMLPGSVINTLNWNP